MGSLPFGMINLNVLYTELTSNRRASLLMAFGAAFIEMIQGIVAAILYTRLVHLTSYDDIFRWAAIAVFIALAIYYLFKPKHQQLDLDHPDLETSNHPFFKGVLLSSLNFMALPFWLVILAMISEYISVDWQNIHLFIFGLGAGIGGFFASVTYMLIGRKFLSQSKLVYQYLDYGLAVLFLILALLAIIS
jgi:threonine/homoserine/homoserine lactone efflux protein